MEFELLSLGALQYSRFLTLETAWWLVVAVQALIIALVDMPASARAGLRRIRSSGVTQVLAGKKEE